MGEERLVTEVPGSLKKLARKVVRGFYTIEDALIVDLLVRNPCMKEDDICELLKFERKMLRARIAILRNDKFIQVRLKMETGLDGKAQKVNYYFINYKTFVNVVKYKLDLMRKKLETEERDATSRASFKCPSCCKTFTDLEADQLFDFASNEFRCTYCREVVEEDQSALPKKDSRLMLARFNDQMEPLYMLLREVEGIKLAPEILEPEPVDLSTIRGLDMKKPPMQRLPGDNWSGQATRSQGFAVEETRVDVSIGEPGPEQKTTVRKERPVWMTESTVVTDRMNDMGVTNNMTTDITTVPSERPQTKDKEDIMSVLLAHERRGGSSSAAASAVNSVVQGAASGSDSSGDEQPDMANDSDEVGVMDSDEDDMVPVIMIGEKSVPVTEVNDTLIAQMTPVEKGEYIRIYQEYYSHMYD